MSRERHCSASKLTGCCSRQLLQAKAPAAHWLCFAEQNKTGALAQLGERLICIQEVRSSILLGSTITPEGCDAKFLDLTAKHCVSVWPSNRTAERREPLVFYIV